VDDKLFTIVPDPKYEFGFSKSYHIVNAALGVGDGVAVGVGVCEGVSVGVEVFVGVLVGVLVLVGV
jgi:hypothetical protein